MSVITRLQADNFKKLTVIDIAPGKGVVPIRGRNAQGKSSTLDAIQAALGGKAVMPSRPVRAGEDEGSIRLELDDGVVILRRFSADGRDSIEVTNAEGFKAGSPQKMLNGLYASVAFDPLAFTRLEPRAQLAQLRGMVELDVDVAALEKQNAADYETRRDEGRDLKAAEATLLRMPSYPDAPAEPLDEAALEQTIAEAAETNGSIERRRVNREQFVEGMQTNRDRLVEMENEIALLQAQAEKYRNRIAEQEAQLAAAEPLPEPVDVAEAQAALRAAREVNVRVTANRQHAAQKQLVTALTTKVEALTKAMDDRKATIAASIERAQMPVDGLSFGDGEVLFKNLPLEQASSAEQLRVSTAIGMAASPKLRVMLVRDGSLLDDEGERILADMAAANDFQLWVEAVDTSGKVGIVLEDGAVVSIDGEPAPEPEAIATPKRRAKKSAVGDPPPASGQGEGAPELPATSPAPVEEIGSEPQKSAVEPMADLEKEISPAPDAATAMQRVTERLDAQDGVRAPAPALSLFD